MEAPPPGSVILTFFAAASCNTPLKDTLPGNDQEHQADGNFVIPPPPGAVPVAHNCSGCRAC